MSREYHAPEKIKIKCIDVTSMGAFLVDAVTHDGEKIRLGAFNDGDEARALKRDAMRRMRANGGYLDIIRS